ncbi:fungal-specific transcription factor domain-containing protein [Mycena olivaceomarginata]|nr:fungal-specific transcription factor domain-containing protein [Mycena olivaceomarginata]
MSEEEQVEEHSRSHSPTGSIPVKQRRPLRSCDTCRQRKIRCDGQSMPDGHCSSCLAFGSPCTYMEPARKRGRKHNLVDELKKENDDLKTENASLKAKLRSLSVCSLCAQALGGPSSGISTLPCSAPAAKTALESGDTLEELSSRFSQFDLDEFGNNYFGASSSFSLADHTIAMKETHYGRPFTLHPRRRLYWDMLPWEKEAYDRRPQYVYPPTDLIDSLLRLYFTNVHPTLPILNRPSFERSVAQGLHLTDTQFGGMLLSVLAIGSRYSKDSRVFVDGDASCLSAGWKFANQIWILRNLFEPTIHEVQMYCILTLYAMGISMPQNSWLYLGIGIRCLHHRGAHRRKPEGPKWESDHDEELWRRAFWSFVALERLVCACIGRPMSLQAEEYDTEPPLQVDDEYWDQGFTQPPGKPSQLSYFVCDLRLCEISADVMRRLYASKKSKILMGWESLDWDQRTVAHFDSMMNDFSDSIPSHLRWDPDSPPQGVFFDQSAVLHVSYHYLMIAIHRPYIQKATRLTATSLSICANAARKILRTADIWFTKLQRLPPQNLINPVFVSGLILLLNMLAAKRVGISIDKNKDSVLVAMAMEFLKVAETRYQPVGRISDILRDVWSFDTQPNTQIPIDAGAYKNGAAEFAAPGSQSLSNFSSPLANELNGNYPHLDIPFTDTSGQSSGSKPGMSIEQLLADAGTPDTTRSVFEDELMSMWMAVPTDVAHMVGGWETYAEDRNVAEVNWFSSFGAPHY